MKPALAIPFLLLCGAVAPASRPPDDVKEPTKRGLDWLAAQQAADGSWSGNGGIYPTALTALAGTALMAEGSTRGEGKYAANLSKAVEWYLKGARPSGLLVPEGNAGEEGRYMLGQGFGLLFLSCAYTAEENAGHRKALAKVLTRAVAFAEAAQTKRGGWGYVAAADGSDFDEGNATVTVLQGLLAARNAGLPVRREVLERAAKYHDAATNAQGGVVYSLAVGAVGEGRPTVTAGAAACALMRGTRPDLLPKWVAFAAKNRGPALSDRCDFHALLHHFYLARVARSLGDDGHRRLDPAARDAELLRWTDYRAALLKALTQAQAADGSWAERNIGPVFGTALVLIILQLDNGHLDIFSP